MEVQPTIEGSVLCSTSPKKIDPPTILPKLHGLWISFSCGESESDDCRIFLSEDKAIRVAEDGWVNREKYDIWRMELYTFKVEDGELVKDKTLKEWKL